MYEGQVVFKPLPYNNNRFKKNDKYLIEVILDRDDKLLHLYYISNDIEVNKEGKLEFEDKRASVRFSECNTDTEINIYDAYTIEHVSTDYDVRKTDPVYTYISRYMIYANRKTMLVIKAGRRKKYSSNYSYEYQAVIKK